MSVISLIRNRHGMALLNMVFIFIFIGVLTVAGVKMYSSIVARGKINDTKGELEREVQMISAWAVKNGRLPTAAEYPGVFGGTNPPVDAWGKSIFYIYDANLTAAATGGLCGRTTTSLTNNAFALVSGGDDYNILSTANGSIITASMAATAFAPVQSDLYRMVPLEELKSKAGCYGTTGGRLRIVNNELPGACAGNAYSATIFVDGGVPPYPLYTISGLPAGLIATGATISGTPTAAGTSSVNVSVTDSHTPSANTVIRAYMLTVKSCSSPPASGTSPIVFTPPSSTEVSNNWNGGTPNDTGTYNTEVPSGKFGMTMVSGVLNAISLQNGTKQSCIWFQAPLALTGRQMRAYFNFLYSSGGGFTFAMVPPAQFGDTTISSCGSNGAQDFTGFDSGIPGNTLLGVEFIDNSPNGQTCITVLGNDASSSCSGNGFWVENQRYYVRAELDTRITPYNYKLWLSTTLPSKFDNLSGAYIGSSPSLTKTLTDRNISDLNPFFLGFTAAQQGNNKVDMNVQGLKFVLCQPGAPGCY